MWEGIGSCRKIDVYIGIVYLLCIGIVYIGIVYLLCIYCVFIVY